MLDTRICREAGSDGPIRLGTIVLILVIIISIMAICARCKREQRGNQRSFEMTDRQSSYEPPVVVQGERVPAPMGRVPPSKLDSPRGAVV